jgi:hypothetical protein
MLLERGRCRGQPVRRAAEVAHGQRNFGLGHHAACTGELLVGAECPGRTPQEIARQRKLAQLRHGDAAQRERRRIVAQRYPF